MGEDNLTPEENDPNSLDALLKSLGAEAQAEFSATEEAVAQQEAWRAVKKIYDGMLSVGFNPHDAQGLVAAYIIRLIGG